MAREFNPNRILHGNEGTAWFNGKKLTTLQSIEAKVSGDFEDINVCGDPSTYRVYNGYSGEGTFTCFKLDSDVVALMAEAFRTGEMPDHHHHHRAQPEGHEQGRARRSFGRYDRRVLPCEVREEGQGRRRGAV